MMLCVAAGDVSKVVKTEEKTDASENSAAAAAAAAAKTK